MNDTFKRIGLILIALAVVLTAAYVGSHSQPAPRAPKSTTLTPSWDRSDRFISQFVRTKDNRRFVVTLTTWERPNPEQESAVEKIFADTMAQYTYSEVYDQYGQIAEQMHAQIEKVFGRRQLNVEFRD